MGREKRNPPAAVVGGPKERHKRVAKSQYDPKAPVPLGFVAKPAIPKLKHHSYFEFVENKEKKKKLEFQVTTKKTPPPGFEFVPIGNPQLTAACKELSRERDSLIFIVSNSKDAISNAISLQVHRMGHHIHETIVHEARGNLDQLPPSRYATSALDGRPEPIPESQAEYDSQVDAALRELFPRIPNTDRQMVIEHAFHRRATLNGEKPVGRSADLSLGRRVQLAVLAHIRHAHTRYDELLRETTWQNARKVVEALCLDILVKWRGDEESGRDQLDEILREVVVISDSEGEEESDEEESEDSSIEGQETSGHSPVPGSRLLAPSRPAASPRQAPKPVASRGGPPTRTKTGGNVKKPHRSRDANKIGQRGFKRYRARQEAIRRGRDEETQPQLHAVDGTANQNLYHQHGYAPPRLECPPGLSGGPSLRADDAPSSLGASPRPFMSSHPAVYGPPSLQPSAHSSPAPQMQHAFDKVYPTVYEQPPGERALRRPASPAVSHLQDLLVQSIEPPSPGTTFPSFVRTLPPRGHTPVNHSPLRPDMRHPLPVSPAKEQATKDELGFFGRRVVSDHAPNRHASPTDTFRGDAVHSSLFRDQGPLRSYHDRDVGRSSPLLYPGPHEPEPEPTFSSWQSPGRRITVDAPRPGERSNPILMEDRGGFYERVQSPIEDRPMPRDAGFVEIRRGGITLPRGPEPHRVVSGEEGSRILEESRGDAGLEVIPISGSHPLPPTRSRMVTEPFPAHHGPPNSPSFRGQPNGDSPFYADHRAAEHRPVSAMEGFARPPGPYWEEQRQGDWPGAESQYSQPVYRHYREPRPAYPRERWAPRPPPRDDEDVVVLD